MGKATELIDDLIARPLSPDELRARREAAKPRHNLVATSHGQLVEPAPAPTQAPRVVRQAPQQTWD
jgi:DNA-binding response OmpR family regulator